MDAQPQDCFKAYQDGNLLEAFQLAKQCLQKHPNDQDLMLLKVRILQNDNILDYLDKADQKTDPLSIIEQLLKNNPHNALAWNEKGILLSKISDKLSLALSCYDQATALEPENYEFWYNKAECLLNMSSYQAAIITFEKYLAHSPKDEEALFYKAMAHAQLKEKTEAIDCLKKAFQFSNSNMRQIMAIRHPSFKILWSNKEF